MSNIYLDPLDQLMAQRGFEMVRYADDFVILCRDRATAERALHVVQEWTASAGRFCRTMASSRVPSRWPGTLAQR